MRGLAGGHPLTEPVAAWDRSVGSREVSFDLGARDVDADGRVWLLFDVHSVGAAAGSNPLSWQIQGLGMSVDAEVTGPPAPIDLGPATTKPADGRTGRK